MASHSEGKHHPRDWDPAEPGWEVPWFISQTIRAITSCAPVLLGAMGKAHWRDKDI